MDRDLTRVRIVSHVAAVATIAAALGALALYRVNTATDAGPPASAVVAFVENPHASDTQIPPPHRILFGASLAETQGEGDNSLRLWRYGPHNEIVFAYAEQFDRCSAARGKHIDQADCPSSRETRAYVLDQSPDPPLVLAYRRH